MGGLVGGGAIVSGEWEWVGGWIGQRAARWVAERGAAGSRTSPLGIRHTHPVTESAPQWVWYQRRGADNDAKNVSFKCCLLVGWLVGWCLGFVVVFCVFLIVVVGGGGGLCLLFLLLLFFFRIGPHSPLQNKEPQKHDQIKRARTRTNTHRRAHASARAHTHTHTHTYRRAHANTHTYTHTHT